MEPLFIDGCLGWIHSGRSRRGVVMCGPLGREGDFIHRSWRRLAEMLAAEGMPTVRFDYRGFGDSLDDDDAPDRIATWVGNVTNAARWLKTTHEIEELAFVGFRFGAALAAAAAGELGGVHSLALLAPVTSGRAYSRELTMMAKMSSRGLPREGENLSAGGITCTPQTLADLQQFEPFRAGGPLAQRILTLTPPGARLDRVLAERLAGSDLDLLQAEFSGYSDLMVDADYAAFPAEAFAKVVDWLRCGPVSDSLGSEVDGAAQVELLEALEHTVFLHGSSRLFGIVCKPKAPRPSAPAVVFLNTGATRHSGTGRIAVLMGRSLAELGLTSFRFDVAGVGDSPDRPGQRDPIEHLGDSFGDVQAALDWLESQGHSSVVLVGFCRGAQLACNIAFRDHRVRGQILIGPPPLFWSDEPAHRVPNPNRRDLKKVATPATWAALLRGDFPPRRLAKAAIRIVGRIVGAQKARAIADRAAAQLRSLKKNGVKTLMIYGENDEFLPDNEEYFSTKRDRLEAHLGVKIEIISEIDHLFLRKEDRLAMQGVAIKFLLGELQPTPPQQPVKEVEPSL